MIKRRVLLGLGLLAAVAVAGILALWLRAPRHQISEANFLRIQKGMTRAEVEEILGAPPGDYSTDQSKRVAWIPYLGDKTPKTPLKGEHKIWKSDDTMIIVVFSPTVVEKPLMWLRQTRP